MIDQQITSSTHLKNCVWFCAKHRKIRKNRHRRILQITYAQIHTHTHFQLKICLDWCEGDRKTLLLFWVFIVTLLSLPLSVRCNSFSNLYASLSTFSLLRFFTLFICICIWMILCGGRFGYTFLSRRRSISIGIFTYVQMTSSHNAHCLSLSLSCPFAFRSLSFVLLRPIHPYIWSRAHNCQAILLNLRRIPLLLMI